jgi:hypothetical protein
LITNNFQTPVVKTVNNTGTAPAKPVLRYTATNAAQALTITNYTTGKAIYLNTAIQPGEVITVDTRLQSLGVRSSIRGDVTFSVLSGSELASFDLLPGENRVSTFARDTGTGVFSGPRCVVYWQNRNLSIDAVEVA